MMFLDQWQKNTDAMLMLDHLGVFTKENPALRRKLVLLALACILEFNSYPKALESIALLDHLEKVVDHNQPLRASFLLDAVGASADYGQDLIAENKPLTVDNRIAWNLTDAVAHLADMNPWFCSLEHWANLFHSLQRVAVLLKDGFIQESMARFPPPYCADLVRDIFTLEIYTTVKLVGASGQVVRHKSTQETLVYEEAWRSLSVLNLASTIYEERCFQDLPILGDALEDAGCDNQIILDHCRLAGQHVRGCWLLDLLLEKPDGHS